MFAPLHMKSEYSLEEGIAPVEDLLRRAADFGYRAAALTDVENLHGQVRFHLAARSLGLRPITGVELRAAPRGGPGRAEPGPRLLLLARDLSGYQSLCRIVSRRRTGDPESLEPLDCLRCEPAGLFFLAEDHGTVSSLLAAGVTADDVRFLRRPGGRPAPADVRP